MLKMKSSCERCEQPLAFEGDAYICSYECTFCPDCTSQMNAICPNCRGELVNRPKRRLKPTVDNQVYLA